MSGLMPFINFGNFSSISLQILILPNFLYLILQLHTCQNFSPCSIMSLICLCFLLFIISFQIFSLVIFYRPRLQLINPLFNCVQSSVRFLLNLTVIYFLVLGFPFDSYFNFNFMVKCSIFCFPEHISHNYSRACV